MKQTNKKSPMPNLLQKILLPCTARPRTATRTRSPAIKPSPEKPGWKQKIPGENLTGKSSNPNLHPMVLKEPTLSPSPPSSTPRWRDSSLHSASPLNPSASPKSPPTADPPWREIELVAGISTTRRI
uniref:Uncharacterized protein n=1 Tax=Setaria viridis TaxID=4556 RepID=A0A4U6VJ12_SETVI|nr:hypothetical protein SEVIR_3G258400v2 [Setaria viridis]